MHKCKLGEPMLSVIAVTPLCILAWLEHSLQDWSSLLLEQHYITCFVGFENSKEYLEVQIEHLKVQ